VQTASLICTNCGEQVDSVGDPPALSGDGAHVCSKCGSQMVQIGSGMIIPACTLNLRVPTTHQDVGAEL